MIVRRYRRFHYMDKREAVRVPVRVRARCRSEDTVVDGLVEDMSRSGLFMRVPAWIGVGSAAEIVLDLPGSETLHLIAQVVRVDDDGIGLRFVDQDRTRRTLANFIMKQHATSR
jgi:hypothetical protein